MHSLTEHHTETLTSK